MVTANFTALGAGAQLLVRDEESLSYSVAGTFVGTVVLERTRNGGLSWEPVLTASAATSGTHRVENSNRGSSNFRFRCTAFTSGTIETTMNDVEDTVLEFKNRGGVTVFRITDEGVAVPGPA